MRSGQDLEAGWTLSSLSRHFGILPTVPAATPGTQLRDSRKQSLRTHGPTELQLGAPRPAPRLSPPHWLGKLGLTGVHCAGAGGRPISSPVTEPFAVGPPCLLRTPFLPSALASLQKAWA